MSSLLEEPAVTATLSPVQRLRSTMAAVRLSFTWFGTRKTLSPAQKAQAAESFGAEGEFLSAGKKLIDTRHPAFKPSRLFEAEPRRIGKASACRTPSRASA